MQMAKTALDIVKELLGSQPVKQVKAKRRPNKLSPEERQARKQARKRKAVERKTKWRKQKENLSPA